MWPVVSAGLGVTTIFVSAPVVDKGPPVQVPAIVVPFASLSKAPLIVMLFPPLTYIAYTVTETVDPAEIPWIAAFSCPVVPPCVIVANVPLVNI